MKTSTTRAGALVMLAATISLGACAPVDVRGNYNGNVTNGQNTCPGTWTVGQQSSVQFEITQSGGDVTVTVGGILGGILLAGLGSATFSGGVAGNTVNARLISNRMQSQGTCQYVIRADLLGRLNGNTMEGTVTYTPDIRTNTSDCASMQVTGCMSEQSFNGLRPPPG